MPIYSASEEIGANSIIEHPGYRSGRYYPIFKNSSTDTNTTGGVLLNFISYYLATIHHQTILSRLAVACAGAVANSNLRLGIYENNFGIPGKLLLDSGNIITATSGIKEAVISFPINPGKYWVGAVTTTSPPNLYTSAAFLGTNYELGQNTPASTSANCGLRNALYMEPNTMPPNAIVDNLYYLTGNIRPFIWFKAA